MKIVICFLYIERLAWIISAGPMITGPSDVEEEAEGHQRKIRRHTVGFEDVMWVLLEAGKGQETEFCLNRLPSNSKRNTALLTTCI